jgi:hypothetical protein
MIRFSFQGLMIRWLGALQESVAARFRPGEQPDLAAGQVTWQQASQNNQKTDGC